ncbi:hypothetical protein UC8_28880 [Roseimaritima ulvae]|uniref:Uncharacterized protein n=1 Tax=Roseimaritima ulvae TaxID=980254 RepID=A0A5B9QT07_9BACT|nr:hypothetical protein UC8_28880 [Roseimaritima ulvae]
MGTNARRLGRTVPALRALVGLPFLHRGLTPPAEIVSALRAWSGHALSFRRHSMPGFRPGGPA